VLRLAFAAMPRVRLSRALELVLLGLLAQRDEALEARGIEVHKHRPLGSALGDAQLVCERALAEGAFPLDGYHGIGH